MWVQSGCRFGAFCLPFGVSSGAGLPASGPAGVGSGPLVRVFPAFCPLYCFALGALLANMALFRVLRAFLGGFMGFVWVCVVLALCVDCGAFVRVWS